MASRSPADAAPPPDAIPFAVDFIPAPDGEHFAMLVTSGPVTTQLVLHKHMAPAIAQGLDAVVAKLAERRIVVPTLVPG